MPIAYEAREAQEISYIHAEAYPAGDETWSDRPGRSDHADRGPGPARPWYEKTISQVEQAKARGGMVIAVANDGDEVLPRLADHILWVPETPWMLSPVTTAIPLQLLAYHIAVLRGADVDQPRNLAKSVTVE
jgi:glucosamine--fructose-6-phosphate aminotransferase (isomerizing)